MNNIWILERFAGARAVPSTAITHCPSADTVLCLRIGRVLHTLGILHQKPEWKGYAATNYLHQLAAFHPWLLPVVWPDQHLSKYKAMLLPPPSSCSSAGFLSCWITLCKPQSRLYFYPPRRTRRSPQRLFCFGLQNASSGKSCIDCRYVAGWEISGSVV